MQGLARGLAAAAVVVAGEAAAEPVAVRQATGQGMLVSHRGNCFAIMTQHGNEGRAPFGVFTSAPQHAGSATVYFRRVEADFAVALVEGSARTRCAPAFGDLPVDVSGLLGAGRSVVLKRVDPQGALEQLAMRVDSIAWSGGYQHVLASTDVGAGEVREVFQGVSGGFLYVGETPVAMVLTAPTATSVRALRLEEIREPLARWLNAGTFGAEGQEAAPATAAPEGLAFRVTEWSAEPVAPDFVAAGLATGANGFRAPPGRTSLVVELDPAGPVPVGALRLAGPAPGGEASPVRSIAVELDRGTPERPRWAGELSLDLPPNGGATVVPLNTRARRIRLTVLSQWDAALPFEISGLQVLAP
jgi:hypothetical protein